MRIKKRIEILIKNNLFLQKIYAFCGSAFFRFVGLFIKQDKKMILFSSYGGDAINDSPKAIYDYISSHFPNYRCIWTINSKTNKPLLKNVEYVFVDTFRYFIFCLRAKYWVTNVNIERGLHFKKRKTFYLNTWHSTTVKTIGNQVKKRRDYNFKNINLLCSDGKYMTDIFVNYFNASRKNIVECGRPREDELLFSDYNLFRTKYRKKYGIDDSKFVILYAPTWKSTNGREDLLKVNLNIEEVSKKLGEDVVFIFKAHHLTKTAFGIKFSERIIDASLCENINELYFVSDLLVSDFSSCFFDFGLLNKPMICFAKDLEKYDKDRGLCIDLRKEFPGGVIDNEIDLIAEINQIIHSGNIHKDQQNAFMRKYVARPFAESTKYCVERMLCDENRINNNQ